MSMRWWTFNHNCSKCSAETELVGFGFAADMELRFDFGCPKCGLTSIYRVYASSLQETARQNDAQIAMKAMLDGLLVAKIGKPLKAPLQIKPPLLTPEDKDFERECGIDNSE